MEDKDSHSRDQGGTYGGSGGGYRQQRTYGAGGYGGGRGRGGYPGPRQFRPAPVRVGEEFNVRIESMSKRGDAGVAKVEGLVIFVAATKVGENVRIRITRVGRGYATAEITEKSEATSAQATSAQATSAQDTSGHTIDPQKSDIV